MTETVEIPVETLEVLRNEAQNTANAIDYEEWRNSAYGRSVDRAIDCATSVLVQHQKVKEVNNE